MNKSYRGKIRFYTLPPEDNSDCFISAEIITDHKIEFDHTEFETAEKNLLDVIGNSGKNKHFTYLSISDNKKSNDSELSNVKYFHLLC